MQIQTQDFRKMKKTMISDVAMKIQTQQIQQIDEHRKVTEQ